MEDKMKLLISADMEGISGVVEPNHCNSSHPEYQRFRRVMTDDVNSAIRGAFKGGADQVVVTDAHGSKTNILAELLDERARLNSGPTAPYAMMQGANDQMDAAMFVGYHARMGEQNAILAHTISGMKISNIWLNGQVSGEFGLNAAFCGHFGVPVLLVSGDLAVGHEANQWVPGIEQVVIKTASGRHSAECIPAPAAQRMIEEAAERAVRRYKDGGAPRPMQVTSPVKITIEFHHTGMADTAAGLPDAVRLDGRRIEVEALDMHDAYLAMRACINLASA
jgi:D-amino peptidase